MLARMKTPSSVEKSSGAPGAPGGLGGPGGLAGGSSQVALVGGASIVVAGLASLVGIRLSGAFVIASVSWSLGLLVLALGLPGRPGVFGSGLVRRWLIVGSAVLSFAVVLAQSLSGSLGLLGPASVDSSGLRAFAWTLTVTDMVSVGLLVAGAILVGRDSDVPQRARRGLLSLAALKLVSYLVPVGVLLVLSPNNVQGAADGLFWFSRLVAILTCAIGLWFAWPWLSPRFAVGRVAIARVYRRYVDSTP